MLTNLHCYDFWTTLKLFTRPAFFFPSFFSLSLSFPPWNYSGERCISPEVFQNLVYQHEGLILGWAWKILGARILQSKIFCSGKRMLWGLLFNTAMVWVLSCRIYWGLMFIMSSTGHLGRSSCCMSLHISLFLKTRLNLWIAYTFV